VGGGEEEKIKMVIQAGRQKLKKKVKKDRRQKTKIRTSRQQNPAANQ
jgi:hypothetical protein